MTQHDTVQKKMFSPPVSSAQQMKVQRFGLVFSICHSLSGACAPLVPKTTRTAASAASQHLHRRRADTCGNGMMPGGTASNIPALEQKPCCTLPKHRKSFRGAWGRRPFCKRGPPPQNTATWHSPRSDPNPVISLPLLRKNTKAALFMTEAGTRALAG